MRLRRPDLSQLLKPYISVFKHTKQGIILSTNYNKINLTELFKINPEECLYVLEQLEDSDIDKYNYKQVREVKEEFKKLFRARE